MKRITVYADFDFLASPQEIGTLGYERVRGKDHFATLSTPPLCNIPAARTACLALSKIPFLTDGGVYYWTEGNA